ncbi:MAG: LD-carboxypeptidase [Lachnospiraceae bacterium]|nr:LD-carboxypeptidase [Lachnospiraceae bacterium]
MRKPDSLEKGQNIGLCATSFGCTIEPYKTCLKETIKKFEDFGYKVTVGDNVYKEDGVGIATNPKDMASEFEKMLLDDSIDALISTGGGELMCEILPYMDWEKVKEAKPKWFLGYSDNTNAILPLVTICDTMAIYGSCAPSFGTPWSDSQQDIFDILTGSKKTVENYEKWEIESLKSEENPLAPYNMTEANSTKAFFENKEIENAAFDGRLIGGCLDCLQGLCGTSFDKVKEYSEKYKEDGIIWFIESCDLNVMGVRRALFQLKNAGWFENVKGFIIGRPMLYDNEGFGITMKEAFLEPLSELNVPIILDADLGHLPPAMPMVAGAKASVSFNKSTDKKFSITYDI